MALAFLHMSDIHFVSGKGFDLDADIRNEIQHDIANLRSVVPPLSGVLVTGDVAFRGGAEEYERATDWLRAIAAVAEIEAESVWAVPGNHDVDRRVASDSALLRSVQRELRQAKGADLDRLISQYAHDTVAAELLRKPLANYLQFARGLRCVPVPPALHWTDTLELNDGSMLCLRGVNSAFASNADDDDAKNRLVVGEFQATAERKSGVTNMLLCHHPPEWLLDRDSFEDIINNRYHVQLFGHKHRQRLGIVGTSLRLYAGAVHPSRAEAEWEPRYNALSILVSGQDTERILKVTVWPRVWSSVKRCFVADRDVSGDGSVTHELPLDAWKRPGPAATKSAEDSRAPVPPEGVTQIAQTEPTPVRLTKNLLYRFYRLPYHVRVEIALQLGLLRDEDEHLPENDRFDMILRRAIDSDLIAKLNAAIEKRERGQK